MADETTTSTGRTSRRSTSKSKDENVETITVEVDKDMDPVHREMLIAQLRPRSAPLIGGIADLQRMGTAAVKGGNVEDGVLPPPGSDPAKAPSLEDVASPGPSTLSADAAEKAYGSRTAQGDRPDKAK